MVCERPPRSLRSRLPLTRGRLARTKGLFSPSVRGRAAEGGRGSLKHGVDWVEPDMLPDMTSKLLLTILIFIPGLSVRAAQQTPLPIQDGQVIPLWQGPAPGALGTQDGDIPVITAFLPRTMAAYTPAVIVCPGGGYVSLASNHEGRQLTSYLRSLGIAAFVFRSWLLIL